MDIDWSAYNAEQKEIRDGNWGRAMDTFESARELAGMNGWTLSKHTEWHFSLSCGEVRYNLYPSNQRIYNDRHHRGPFLKVPKSRTFLDVVSAAIIKTQIDPLQKAMKV